MLHRLRLLVGKVILWFALPALTDEARRMTPADWTDVDRRSGVVAAPEIGWELNLGPSSRPD
ncbi:hypothetical protein [Azospirillum argentinense]